MDFQSELEAKFYTQSDSLSSVFRAASNVCYRGGQINGAIFSSAQSINKLARRLQEGNARVRGFRLSKMNPCLLESRISPNKLKSSRNSKAMAFFWESKRDSVVFLLSCQQRFVFDYLCSKLHAYILPDLSRVFLKTKEII